MTTHDLRGKRILVTGGANGIGRAVCERALRAGATLLIADREEIDPQSFGRETAGRVVTQIVDLAEVGRFDELADSIENELGGLDAIIHVAGVMVRRSSIDEVTEADFDFQYQVNLKAAFFLVTRLRRLLTPESAIVLFSSQGWWTGGLGGSLPYSATKAGVVSLVRGLSRELAPQKIRINAIAPGFVDTDMMRIGLSEERRAELIAQVPLGRLASVDEVADATLFLVGESSRYMTGTTLNVTGGQLIY